MQGADRFGVKGGAMDEIIKMLKKYKPDFDEMDAGEIKTIVEVLDAFISDYRAVGWDDVAMGYGIGKWEEK